MRVAPQEGEQHSDTDPAFDWMTSFAQESICMVNIKSAASIHDNIS